MTARTGPLVPAMASRWRRRPLCAVSGKTAIGGPPASAVLIEVSGRGARIATTHHLAPGTRVTLRHPEAGAIDARVIGGDPSDLWLAFEDGTGAIAFALAAVTADMSRAD